MKVNKIAATIAYAVLILISLIMIYPFLWMIFSSFKTNTEIIQNPLSLWPQSWTTVGYEQIMVMSKNSIWHYTKNSIILSVGITTLTILATSLGGYALYRKKDLPLFGLIEKSFMLSLMYPAVLLLIPLYVMVVNLHMYDTGNYLGIILASSASAWGAALPYFLFKQFFYSMPYELIEAASIDGASETRIFFRVVFPAMRPVFTTSILIAFLTSWGNWLPVLVLSKDMSTYNLPAMLVNLNSELGVDLSQTAALCTVITLPVVIVFLLTQKKVMEGIAAGSVKG